jgi:serine/threonine protein kinase
MLRSERTTTSLGTTLTGSAQTITVRDFLSLLSSHDVKRVQIESMTQYRKTVLSNSGSQFTIYTDDGIKRYGQPDAVVKCAKFKLSKTAAASDTRTQVRLQSFTGSDLLLILYVMKRLVTSIYKEVLTLTHQRLRDHPNITRLLYYDLVNQSDNYVVPALIVERAKYGSLAEYLSRQEGLNVGSMADHVAQDSALTLAEKLNICGDIIAGLVALHITDVAHGDVKSDNVLLFENPGKSQRYLAKLSDFGSIIPLLPPRNERSSRYLGTPTWNAPEVENQSESWFLDSKGVLKCDAYSLGLTIMHVISGILQPELMSKEIDVRERALLSIEKAGLPPKDQASVSEVIKRLLLWEPSQRCSDLSIVLNIIRPVRASDVLQSK